MSAKPVTVEEQIAEVESCFDYTIQNYTLNASDLEHALACHRAAIAALRRLASLEAVAEAATNFRIYARKPGTADETSKLYLVMCERIDALNKKED